MDIRITNATGKDIFYKVIDYEGPFTNFNEDILPGMYPDTQSTYTASDSYYPDTEVRKTIFSRYPKFASSRNYMSNFGEGQKPSLRSYDEVKYNYPEQYIGSTRLDGNEKGIIASGETRDIMLRDINCNMYFRTIGNPVIKRNDDDKVESFTGSALTRKPKIYDGDPRYGDYEATIKVARLRETKVVICIQSNNTYYVYDRSGTRVSSEYVYDCSYMPLQLTNKQFNPDINPRRLGTQVYPFAAVNTLPKPTGTYIDMLRKQELIRKSHYAKHNPNMYDYNYSNDYDKPILGYFDRRWLNKPNY